MNVNVKANELGRALKLCSSAIDPKDAIRSNVSIVAENDLLWLKASNGQYSIELSLPSEMEEEGEAVVDCVMAYRCVSKASNVCKLSSDERHLTIKANGRTKLTMMTKDVPMLEDTEGQSITFDSAEFKSAIDKIGYSIGEDQSKMILTGAHIVTDGFKAEFTGLDGFRLAQTSIDCEGDSVDIVVPSRILYAICDAIDGDKITLITDGTHVTICGNGFKINAVMLSGKYIDTTRIIPQEFKTNVLVKTAEIKDLIDSATVASGSNNLVKLQISQDKVTVLSNSEEVGADFMGDIDAIVEGNDILIAFNLKYLIQAFNHIDTEQCELKFNQATGPAIFSSHKDGAQEIHLILPVRVYT